MNAFAPEGWTRTPKPMSLSSQAIQGLSAGWRVSTVRLVRVSLTLAVRFPVVVFMMRRGLAGSRKADSTQRQHLASDTRTVGNTGEPVSEGTASTHR